MATHTKTITLTDLQQQILSNDLLNNIVGVFALDGTNGSSANAGSSLLLEDGGDTILDEQGAGLDTWIQGAVNGQINRSWKQFQNHWTGVLLDDASYTDGIPSNQSDFVTLILARDDYKNAKEARLLAREI